MGADTNVYNAYIDVILHQWLCIPEYLYKRSIYMHIKVKFFLTVKISHIKHDAKTINDSVSVIISYYVRYLLKICSER